MKFASIIILSFFTIQSCGCHNISKTSNSKNQITAMPSSQIKTDSIAVEYTKSSRGSYQKLIATEKGISKSNKRGKAAAIKPHGPQDWNTLLKMLENIDVQSLSKLEPPSKDFQFDGAPISRLKINLNGKTYETQAFDHGNPPKEIAELIKELLSISEMIE